MASLEEIEEGDLPVIEHSMPVYSEIEGETQRRSTSRTRPAIIICVGLTILVALILGLAIGLGHISKETPNTSADLAQSAATGGNNNAGSNLRPTTPDVPTAPVPSPEKEEEPAAEPAEGPVPQEEPSPEEGSTITVYTVEEPAMEEEPVTEEEESKTSSPSIPSSTPAPSFATPETIPEESIPEIVVNVSLPPAEDPEDAITSTRIELITEYLVYKGVVSMDELQMEGSYANKALNWIAHEDNFLLPVPLINGQNRTNFEQLGDEEIFETRYVMAYIYYALGGPKWKHQANFLSGKPTCQWMEVVNSIPIGVGCTPKDDRVRSLFLNGNELQNHLPSQLGLLTDLIMLDLGTNFVMGTLPDSFQALTHMEILQLGSAGLSGTLPSWIGTLSKLGSLNLGYNVMHGTIPSQITNLSVLRELALDNNAFEGDVNALFSNDGLSSLEELFLDSNAFVGTIGVDFASSMENLTQLDLSDNAFEGPVPEHFFSYPKLEVLDIHDNSFTSLPNNTSNTALKFFAAQKNALVGNIEGMVGLSGLTHLDLSQNQLTGSMPESLGENVVGLTYLFLAENDFDPGYIPFSLSNLFSLKELSLKGTSRTGVIPDVLGMMTGLKFLDLDNNELAGEIPSTLGSLTNLELLLLNRNSLVSGIPSEFEKLSELKTLFLEGNNITAGLNHACGIVPDGDSENTSLGANGATLSVQRSGPQREIVAQCSLCDTAPGCCSLCCEDGVACNTKIHVADLDPIWQLSYERIEYALDKEDLWRRNLR